MLRRLILPSIALTLSCAFPAASQDASKLFAQRCGDCHSARTMTGWARKLPDAEQRRQWLDGFLRTHYPPSEPERALIIEHIQSQIARR